jgi:hypothetical protein
LSLLLRALQLLLGFAGCAILLLFLLRSALLHFAGGALLLALLRLTGSALLLLLLLLGGALLLLLLLLCLLGCAFLLLLLLLRGALLRLLGGALLLLLLRGALLRFLGRALLLLLLVFALELVLLRFARGALLGFPLLGFPLLSFPLLVLLRVFPGALALLGLALLLLPLLCVALLLLLALLSTPERLGLRLLGLLRQGGQRFLAAGIEHVGRGGRASGLAGCPLWRLGRGNGSGRRLRAREVRALVAAHAIAAFEAALRGCRRAGLRRGRSPAHRRLAARGRRLRGGRVSEALQLVA